MLEAKPPPFDIEAERAVLGSILLDPQYAMPHVAALRAADFYDESHRIIYLAVEHVRATYGRVDRLLVKRRLEESGVLATVHGDGLSGEAYLARLVHPDVLPSAASVNPFAGFVIDKARQRRIRAAVLRHENDGDEAALRAALDEHDVPPCAAASLVAPFDADDDPVASLATRRNGIVLPMPGVDVEPLTDELVLLGGASSVGKTTLLVQQADALNEAGTYVLVVAAEQSRRKWEAISLARRTRANSVRIMRGDWPEGKVEQIREALAEEQRRWREATAGRRRYAAVFPSTARGVAELVDAYRCEVPRGARSVVILDGIHNLRGPGNVESRRVELDEFAETLRGRVCQRLRIPVVAACQLSRAGELKESGGLEYLADVVLRLELEEARQEEYRRDFGATGVTLEGDSYSIRYVGVRVTKQRDGDLAAALLAFHPPTRRLVAAFVEGGP